MLNLDEIWSDEFYEQEAKRIEIAYWEIIKQFIPDKNPPRRTTKTEHRIESLVRKLSRETGKGNLHVGLTSSDLEDNIRHERLRQSNYNIEYRVAFLGQIISSNFRDKQIIAYTHLVPAGNTTLMRRLALGGTIAATAPPKPVFRGIKGALGDRRIQHLLGVQDSKLDEIFPGRVENVSSQASNKEYDYDTACWLAKVATGLAKMANDVRLMIALDQAKVENNDIGSTALPHKRPNPWRFERASGMCEVLFDLPGRIARTMANCLLERTLTDQSLLSYSFKEAYEILSKIIIDIEHGLNHLEILPNKMPYDSEEMMLKFIKQGYPREEAHKKVKEYADKRS